MASLRLAGKVALVTGSSQGIGRSCALALAAEGAKVVVNYNSSSSLADKVVSELGGSEHAIAIQADVSKTANCVALIEKTISAFGRLDILALNAGAISHALDLENITEENYDKMYSTNVKGPLFLVQAASKHLGDGGRVIFFSTSLTVSSNVSPGYLLYVSTKGAIEQMTRVLAKDLGRKGVTVNAIAPGPTATEGFYEGKTEQVLKLIASWHPGNRIGQPEEIAGMVTLVASPQASWLNGQIVRVNGGMTVG